MTLKDVAVITGCSVATVSKVFKNSPEISINTKNRVLEAAKECGYINKAVSHNTVLGAEKILIIDDPEGFIFNEFNLLYENAKKLGIVLLYTVCDTKTAKKLLRETGAIGLVIRTNKKDHDSNNKNIMYAYENDVFKISEFFKFADSIRPVRAARKNDKANDLKEKSDKEAGTYKPKRSEEIWLL